MTVCVLHAGYPIGWKLKELSMTARRRIRKILLLDLMTEVKFNFEK